MTHSAIGSYPTPVDRLARLGTAKTALWVKRDDLTNATYGGNKVRKLERLIDEARRRGKKRIVTVGAAGSHHVLATALFAGRAGLEVDAVLVPQRRTPHVADDLRADVALGAHLFTARSYAGAALGMVAHARRDAYLVPMGGSNVVGALGYVDAAFELADQIKSGALPEPDVAIVTVGSGGTAAGLAAGMRLAGLRTELVGVVVASPPFFVRLWTRRLAREAFWSQARDRGIAARAAPARGIASPNLGPPLRSGVRGSMITFTSSYLGAGYGEPTAAGEKATAVAADAGLSLDATYTAKCFAAALDYVQSARFAHVLYWHTLSSAPLAPLLEGAPSEGDLAPALRGLLR